MVLLVVLVVAKRCRDDERTNTNELAEALAEADRLDPGWRLEEIEAHRTDLPDNANGAKCVQVVDALLPQGWPSVEAMAVNFTGPPNELLPEDMLKLLRDQLKLADAALAEARKLERLSMGRFDVKWEPDFISTPLTSFTAPRQSAYVLQWKAWSQCQDGEVIEALTTARAILNAGRSFGDEPRTVAQLVRLGIEGTCSLTLERSLAMGVASDEALVSCQIALAEEQAHPTHLIMRRCERIWTDRFLHGLADGSMNWSHESLPLFFLREKSKVTDAEMAQFAHRLHGRLLSEQNQIVEIAKRPLHEQRSLLESHKQTVLAAIPERAKELVSDATLMLKPCQIGQTRLRCAIAAMAAERFRLKNGRWPDSLAELMPAFLDVVPLGPFDGKPLRLRRLDDGIVIYTIGNDGIDHGGMLSKPDGSRLDGVDFGFRLWDEDHRRVPAKGPAKP